MTQTTNTQKRITNREKRAHVVRLLNDEHWCQQSSRAIADECGVSHTMVDYLRERHAPTTSTANGKICQETNRCDNTTTENAGNFPVPLPTLTSIERVIITTFYDYPLSIVAAKIPPSEEEIPYVAMRAIVEGMGLEWRRQYLRLQSQVAKFNCVLMYAIASDGKKRQTLCIPLRKLNGWLFTINPQKVRADLRDKVERYQEECFEVLYQHWLGQTSPPPPQPSPDLDYLQQTLQMTQAKNDQLQHHLFRANERWYDIYRARNAGFSATKICRLLGGIKKQTLYRALHQMAECGLVTLQQRGDGYSN